MNKPTVNPHIESIIDSLTDEEYNSLKEKIQREGFDVAFGKIIVWQQENCIVDGHHRQRICNEIGIEPVYEYKSFETLEDVEEFVHETQLGRRNLTPEKISYHRGKLFNIRKKRVGRNWGYSDNLSGLETETSKVLGKQFNVSERTIERDAQAAKALDNLPEEQRKEYLSGKSDIKKGDLQVLGSTIKEHAKTSEELFAQPKTFEEEVTEKVKTGELSVTDAAKQIRQHKNQVKKETRKIEIEQQRHAIESGALPELRGKFDVIVIDPPWNYGREYDPDGSRVANPYPELTQGELMMLNVPSKDDCVLWLWTTHQFIWDAKELMDKWGFTYKAALVWNKEKIGMGAWLRMQCEFCLLGIKGKPYFNNTSYRDIIIEPRREHSRKPDAFYAMVDEICAGSKLEYFAREQRKGWEVFGNDVDRFNEKLAGQGNG